VKRIVLAYSGSLESSAAIAWLREAHQADVVAVTVDLGQRQQLEEVRDRALAAGAVRAHVLDLRDTFARDFVIPSLEADAVSDNGCPSISALGRPLIARAMADIAAIEQASGAAHACAAGSRDEARIEAAVCALNPLLPVFAPVRQWHTTRAESGRPLHADGNLWGRELSGGVLADPWAEPPEEIYVLTQAPSDRPAEPAYVEIAFDRGAPAAINGVAMPILDLVGSLTTIAGAHGVGRMDTIVPSPTGAPSRQVCEAPAAVVLHAAHSELQTFVTEPDLTRFARKVSRQYAGLVENGAWFTPMREALDACVGQVQERVTGTVRLKLFKGDCRIVGRQSPHAAHGETMPARPLAAGA
jgi:argininosuccinate synthase